MRGWMLVAALGLTGCAQLAVDPVDPATLTYSAAETAVWRGYEQSFSGIPFERGALSVIAAEHDPYNPTTYGLFPCGTGLVCGGGAHGPHGTLEVTPEFWVVRGLYGREFWLSPGGDGAVRYPNGTAVPLAWNARGQGQP